MSLLESKVAPGREPLVWTEGRAVGAKELILAPGPLNLYSKAGHRNQGGTRYSRGISLANAKIPEANIRK